MTRAVFRLAAVVALTAAAGSLPGTGLGGTASAIDQSKGHPGFCTSGTGVTVVVDFQQLGGTTIVRCDPQGSRGTGLDALKNAGFQVAGVQRWGEAFICRIENRPSAVEEIPVNGDPHYKESCVDTPPAAGYWSYWHAGNNCPWDYSQWGVKNRDFTPGGFEGWSYSLNATADSNPVPRIAPVRPGTSGQPCATASEPAPRSNDPNEKQQPAQGSVPDGGTAGDPSGTGGNTPGPGSTQDSGTSGTAGAPGTTANPSNPAAGGTGRTLPPPKPRARASGTAPDPSTNVAFTGGENAPDVNRLVREQSGASTYAPWVAGTVVILLAAAAWWTARRRRRAREV